MKCWHFLAEKRIRGSVVCLPVPANRHVPSLVADELCLKAVVVSEQYSDGMATKAELCKALNDAQSPFPLELAFLLLPTAALR